MTLMFHRGYVHPDVAYNALRQHHVNRVAEHLGAGTGTARYFGVPGVDDYRYAAAATYGGPAYGGYGGYGQFAAPHYG